MVGTPKYTVTRADSMVESDDSGRYFCNVTKVAPFGNAVYRPIMP